MPKLNRKKLQYIKDEYTISDSLKRKGGFYNIDDSAISPKNNVPRSQFRGYHTYYNFGPTPRRHEEENDVKNVKENDEDELSL